MSIPAISPWHSFGVSSGSHRCIHILSDRSILYPSGSYLILHSTSTKRQRFIPIQFNAVPSASQKPTENKETNAAAAKPNTQLAKSRDTASHEPCNQLSVLAPNQQIVAVTGEVTPPAAPPSSSSSTTAYPSPAVLLLDITTGRRKKLFSIDTPSSNFIDVGFSNDSKILALQTGAPSYELLLYQADRGCGKLLARMVTGEGVRSVTFNRRDKTGVTIAVSGTNLTRVLRYTDGNLSMLGFNKIEPRNYTFHAWASAGSLCVGTSTGDLHFFRLSENKNDLLPLRDVSVSDLPRLSEITAMIPHSKGLIVGTADGTIALLSQPTKGSLKLGFFGTLTTFDGRQGLREAVAAVTGAENLAPSENAAQRDSVIALALNMAEDTVLCLTQGRNLLSAAVRLTVQNDDLQAMPMDYAIPHGHAGSIVALDTCVRRPLLATGSTDGTVKIWNYLSSELELSNSFVEQPLSLSLHPSGLFLLVGFGTRLRFFNVLQNDLKTSKEFPIKGCRQCRFSRGGQYFATAHGNVLQIFDTWTLEPLNLLKGHKGRILTLSWSDEDSHIVSGAADGAVYKWDVFSKAERQGDIYLKAHQFTSLVTNGEKIIAVSTDSSLREIKEGEVNNTINSSHCLTQLTISPHQNLLFAGTSKGAVRAVKFPLVQPEGFLEDELFQEHVAHRDSVAGLVLAHNDSFLISASADGTFMIWKIVFEKPRELTPVHDDDVLVGKSELETLNKLTSELQNQMSEIQLEHEYQLRTSDAFFHDKVRNVTDTMSTEIKQLQSTIALLERDRLRDAERYQMSVTELESSHRKDLDDMDSHHKAVLVKEFDKYRNLEVASEEAKATADSERDRLQSTHSDTLETLKCEHKKVLEVRDMTVKRTEQALADQKDRFMKSLQEIEEDFQTQLCEVQLKYETKLQEEREHYVRLKGENGVLRRKGNDLEGQIEGQKSEIQRVLLDEKKMKNTIRSLEKDIAGFKKEIIERDDTIQDKEMRIYDLKSKNQELEKFRFVLDYKIQELRKQLGPQEEEVEQLTTQTHDLEKELASSKSRNTDLKLVIDDLRHKLRATRKQSKLDRGKIAAADTRIRSFQKDITDAADKIQRPNELKNQITGMYHRHCVESKHASSMDSHELDHNVERPEEKEQLRQRVFLEKTILKLKKRVEDLERTSQKDRMMLMKQNVALLRDINQLKKMK